MLPVTVVLFAFFLNGCRTDVESAYRSVKPMSASATESGHDELSKSLVFLEEMDQYEPLAARRQAYLGINRWIARQPDTDDWTLDPLTDELPRYLSDVLRKMRPDESRFQEEDISYLQAHMFLRDIARFAAETAPPDPLVEQWIAADTTLTEEQRRDLSVTARMFDWTVRSIQLTPSRPNLRHRKPSVGPRQLKLDEVAKEASVPPASRVGPGELFYVSETLLKGHGDMVDRARIFILLSRQRGIPVVVLAREDDEFVEPQPWLCGAVIGAHLYLFDTALGLPIPHVDRSGIATLEYVHTHPEILRELDAPDEPYPVRAGDVRRVTVQLDASPQALSRRMRLVERRLAGDRKMILTAQPSELAARLQDVSGVERIEILRAPYVVLRYRKELQDKIRKDKKTANPIARQLIVVRSMPPLFQARLLHFRGQFDAHGVQAGAKSLYLTCRPPDAVLKEMATDENSSQMRLVVAGKQAASYWMGLIMYDNSKYNAAEDWFAQRTLRASPNGPWTHGARYNLGRIWEMLNEPQRAQEIYRADDSPQRAGNSVRAALLD